MTDPRYHKIENHPDLIRDTKTNAVINKNSDVVQIARARKLKAMQQEQDINDLKNEMAEIKNLLHTLINNSNNELQQ
jgi:hypothetical protein